MPTVRLTWTDRNSGLTQEDEFRVYRDTAPFDADTLPAVLATLAADVETYDDETAVENTSYWYAVAAEKDGVLAFAFTGEAYVPPAAGIDFLVTVPSGSVGSDLSDFPLLINLADMPPAFWAVVALGGPNLRAYASDGTTRLPLDVIQCLNTTEVGVVAVKTDLLSASDNEIIIRVVGGTEYVLPSDTYGMHAVWSDYKAVVVGGQDFSNRSGATLSKTVNLPQGFNLVSTSASVTGHGGVVGDGSTFVLIATNALRKYNSALTTVTDTNSAPATDAGSTSCEGGFYYDGKIYVTLVGPAQIGVYDYATLDFIESFDISANGTGTIAIERNPVDGHIYGVIYDNSSPYTDVMQKYDITDGSYLGTFTITSQLSAGRLRTVNGLVWYRDGFYAGVDAFDRYSRISQEGVMQDGGEFGDSGMATLGDGFSFGDDVYVFIRTGTNTGVVRRYSPVVVEFGAGVANTSGNGRITPIITTDTVWTMRGEGKRQTTTSGMGIVALHPGGASLGNGVVISWVSGSGIRGAFDSSNGALNYGATFEPGLGNPFMCHVAYDGTTARHAWHSGGNKVTDSTITARGSDLDFLVAGGSYEGSGSFVWQGDVGLCYVRAGILSDDWIAAEYDNWSDPAAFYTITEL